ncbi:peptidoglycan-binding domain-containing protein [Hoeflea poritis]|uniref:Peptidoglycan-binding domain-containing protein n=1 Tax=Hoeflea poritis TaxID=2993659 RepID=A0ABT4VTW7_9HYPH|nr:peptidoglycan-binding domain-containing protein [Hoeflea poritis]MDA4848141.1 peptidoglycan-binding domain-containing protein [Hoeflea poritis]
MSRRKRPEAKPRRFQALFGLVRSFGELIARHPSIAGGTTVFAVAFTFVSVNALVYQPGKHPAPLYDTRGVTHKPYPLDMKNVPVPSSRVTTYRIEHSDPQSTASIPPRRTPAPEALIYDLQLAMRRGGFYGGAIDGVFGPQTQDAILAYQLSAGLEPTGKASDELIVHVRLAGGDPVAVPKPKPGATQQAAPAPNPPAQPKATEDAVADLIMDIQRGLSNIAYADVKVDGVIGKQTTTAIADFQRHYRLPVTGQPDKLVLQKLREIGAL